MGSLYAPNIEYEYTVMRDERDMYVWALTDEWGPCDKICSGKLSAMFIISVAGTVIDFSFCATGEQTRIYVCIRKETGEEARGYCSEQEAPHPQKQQCNLHCSIKLVDFHNPSLITLPLN